MIEQKMQSYTRELCEQETNILTPHFYAEHIALVSDYADQLGRELGGDPEVIELASCLHDISAIINFNTLPSHHLESANLAADLLEKHDYPREKIDHVRECIEKHTTPIQADQGTIEAVCVSNADAMSQIANPAFWIFFAVKLRSLDYAVAKQWYLDRIDANWNALIEPARNIVEEKYWLVKKAME